MRLEVLASCPSFTLVNRSGFDPGRQEGDLAVDPHPAGAFGDSLQATDKNPAMNTLYPKLKRC